MKIYIQNKPVLSANAHNDVTDFKLDFKFHEMLRNQAAYLKDGKWLFSEVENLTWAWKRTFWENITF